MSALRELLLFFGTQVDTKPLDSAEQKMQGLVDVAQRSAAAIGLAFGLKEIGEFIVGQVEVGAELAHTSEMLGMTVGDFQALSYAAQTAGLSTEEATNAVRFLNRNMGEAAKGSGDTAQAFAQLGVHVKDASGQIRPTQDVFAEVADGFQKIPNAAQKTAVAMQIFGRAGARMIPLLNKGSAGLAELGAEFEALGGGIDEEFVAQAEEAEHGLVKIRTATRGLESTIAGALLPTFMSLVDWVTKEVVAFREFSEHSYIVQDALVTLGVIAGGLIVVWGILNFEILLVVAAVALLILAVDDVYTAFKGGKSVIGDFIDSIFGIGATQVMFQKMKIWIDELELRFQSFIKGIGEVGTVASAAANEALHAVGLRTDADYEQTKKDNDASISKAEFQQGQYEAQYAADTKKSDLIDHAPERNQQDYDAAQEGIGAKEDKETWFRRTGRAKRQANGDYSDIDDGRDDAHPSSHASKAFMTAIDSGAASDGALPRPGNGQAEGEPMAAATPQQQSLGGQGLNAPLPWNQMMAPTAPVVQAPAGAVTNVSNHVEQHNDIRQTIDGGSSPRETGKAVLDGTTTALHDSKADAFAGLPTVGGY